MADPTLIAPFVGGALRLRGHLDSITASGYFEGWALDERQPLHPQLIAVLREGETIATGLAHRFRRDLMEMYCGTGWCAFRVRLLGAREGLHEVPLTLIEANSGTVLHTNPSVAYVADAELPADTVDRVCAYDPTVIEGIWQLRACEKLIMAFIRRHGVEHFVRMAYIYVLGRPADDGGLAQYGRSVRQSSLTPVGVLEALADSDEYRSQPRQLIAPNALGFPFAI